MPSFTNLKTSSKRTKETETGEQRVNKLMIGLMLTMIMQTKLEMKSDHQH